MLGEGGAGRIYAAERVDGAGAMPLAVKVLAKGSLEREARITALLRHRNLVDIYEVGQSDGVSWCAMERCDGTLEPPPALPPRAIVEVGLQVCAALAYAHEELGLIHLDLKPSNLLHVGATVKVADLGIARARGFSSDKRIIGTLRYMPPEQAAGADLDSRADIYALGVTLAELAGAPRSGAATFTLEDVETVDPPAVAPWFQAVLERCIAHRPEDRYDDMKALAAALQALPVEGPGLAEVLGCAPVEPHRTPGELIGRASEQQALDALLTVPGLITIKGGPGIGKSRLAREVGGLWCSLDGATTARDLRFRVASVLGTDVDRIGPALAGRGPLVLVLDDADGVISEVDLLRAWMREAPEVRFVASCRRPFDVPGERVLELGPLDDDDARALLVERARVRGVDIERTRVLEELVRRLDGIPLAIELAAGRLGVLGADEVLERLEPDWLRGEDPGRHSTLGTAIALSWNELDARAQLALRQLAVFDGGAPLDAAEAVVGADALEQLGVLIGRSLVLTRRGRVTLLEPVRAWVEAHGDADAGAEERHGRWFAEARPHGDEELPNLVAATRRALERTDADVAAACVGSAAEVLHRRGPLASGIALLSAVRGLTDRPELALDQAAMLSRAGDRTAALAIAEDTVARCRALDHALLGRALYTAGKVSRELGHSDRATTLAEEALEHARRTGDIGTEGAAQGLLGHVAWNAGSHELAGQHFEISRDRNQTAGDRAAAAIATSNLAAVRYDQSRLDEAEALLEIALRESRAVGDTRSQGIVLGNMAGVAAARRDYKLAMVLDGQAIEIARRVGNRPEEANTLCNLGWLAYKLGQLEAAHKTLLASLRVHALVGDPYKEGLARAILADVEAAEGRPQASRTAGEEARALAQRAGEPFLEAEVTAHLALLAWERDERDLARSLLAEAQEALGRAGSEGRTAGARIAQVRSRFAERD